MKCKYASCVFFAVFYTCAALSPYNCTDVCTGLENSSENGSENGSDYGDSMDYIASTEIINSNYTSLRLATPCESPNHEPTYCLEISKCEVLNAVKSKKKYAAFVDASRCGPNNENPDDFKVCCGKYNSFRNFSKTTGDDHGQAALENGEILPSACGTQKLIIRARIVGGTEAILGEYPWMARIIHKNNYGIKSYGCAGFLIHTKYAVTAAHCILSEFSEIRGKPYSIMFGEHNTTTRIDCSPGGTLCADPPQISKINEIIVHPNYSNTSKDHHNDIALIHLKKGIKFTDFVQPICLLTDSITDARKYYISGWGRTETHASSPVKQKVDLVPYERDECQEKFRMLELEIADTQICAGGEKMKDSCNGDSGGPLMFFNGTHYFAAGLVSYGIGCGMEGWPGVYTSVPSYADWLKSQMIQIDMKSPKVRKNKRKKFDKKNK